MKARLALAVLLVASINPVALSDTVIVPLDHGSVSGWNAIFDDDVAGVVVDVVTDDYVMIQIEPKIFLDFAPIAFTFQQHLPDAVGVIRIADESITNATGVEWTDFHWELMVDSVNGTAVFDDTDPGNFNIAPFTNKDLHPATLDADAGIVLPGGLFSPGHGSGPLYIVTDPGQELLRFTLIQYPTPEPVTMAMLALGSAAVLMRRRRRKA